MSGPNREWFMGNRGPDYHCESQRRVRHGSQFDRPKVIDAPKPRERRETKPK